MSRERVFCADHFVEQGVRGSGGVALYCSGSRDKLTHQDRQFLKATRKVGWAAQHSASSSQ